MTRAVVYKISDLLSSSAEEILKRNNSDYFSAENYVAKMHEEIKRQLDSIKHDTANLNGKLERVELPVVKGELIDGHHQKITDLFQSAIKNSKFEIKLTDLSLPLSKKDPRPITQASNIFPVFFALSNTDEILKSLETPIHRICAIKKDLGLLLADGDHLIDLKDKTKALRSHIDQDLGKLRDQENELENCKGENKSKHKLEQKIEHITTSIHSSEKRIEEKLQHIKMGTQNLKEKLLQLEKLLTHDNATDHVDTEAIIEMKGTFSRILSANSQYDIEVEDNRFNVYKIIAKLKFLRPFALVGTSVMAGVLLWNIFPHQGRPLPDRRPSSIEYIPTKNNALKVPEFSKDEQALLDAMEADENDTSEKIPDDVYDAYLDHPIILNYFDEDARTKLHMITKRDGMLELLNKKLGPLQEAIGEDFIDLTMRANKFSMKVDKSKGTVAFVIDKTALEKVKEKFGNDFDISLEYMTEAGEGVLKIDTNTGASKWVSAQLFCQLDAMEFLIKIPLPEQFDIKLKIDLPPGHILGVISVLKKDSGCP